MQNITATVIVCVYNGGDQITACLASLLAMDFQDYQIVVIDDGSTDDTPSRLEEFKRLHPTLRITVVRNERNSGVSASRNVGIEASSGEFVFFIDSDCTVDPRWLGTFIKGFDRPGVAAVAGTVIDAPPKTLAERAYAGSSRIGRRAWQGRSLVGNNMGFRREHALYYHFDSALTYYYDEDDIAWRMQADGHYIAFVPEAIVQHNHRMGLRAYLRQARLQGQGVARFWYKRGMYVGRELYALTGALVTSPLGILDARLLAIPALFASLQVAALAYNEVALKGKGLWETIGVLPYCILHDLWKVWGVSETMLRIARGQERGIRDSKRSWCQRPLVGRAPVSK
jgi:glycosyltransferase involved in cell wall biosynthesis